MRGKWLGVEPDQLRPPLDGECDRIVAHPPLNFDGSPARDGIEQWAACPSANFKPVLEGAYWARIGPVGAASRDAKDTAPARLIGLAEPLPDPEAIRPDG